MKKYSKYWYRFLSWINPQRYKLKFITWWFSLKINKGKYCWTDCVHWSYSSTRYNPFKIDSSSACERDSVGPDGACYCGQWFDGNCWDKLNIQQQNEYREKLDKERGDCKVDGLPF